MIGREHSTRRPARERSAEGPIARRGHARRQEQTAGFLVPNSKSRGMRRQAVAWMEAEMKMTYWLGGAAIAALVMAGTPAIAQTNAGSPPAAGAPGAGVSNGDTGMQTPSTMRQGQQQRKHSESHARRHKKGSQARSGSSEPTAQQLNRQELQRLDQTKR
jgi:hypothetical protein